jgi:hypothetical protein
MPIFFGGFFFIDFEFSDCVLIVAGESRYIFEPSNQRLELFWFLSYSCDGFTVTHTSC